MTNKIDYYRLKKEGRCVTCRKPRGKDGTTTYCRKCADKINKCNKERRQTRFNQGLCRECGKYPLINKHFCTFCAVRHLHNNWLLTLKRRAKKAGLPFDLTLEDLKVPDVCPILGIPLYHKLGTQGTTANSPTVDRFYPEKGYTKENTHVISYKANAMKRDATLEEIRNLLNWMEKEINAHQL